jgi:hypothetical protein
MLGGIGGRAAATGCLVDCFHDGDVAHARESIGLRLAVGADARSKVVGLKMEFLDWFVNLGEPSSANLRT